MMSYDTESQSRTLCNPLIFISEFSEMSRDPHHHLIQSVHLVLLQLYIDPPEEYIHNKTLLLPGERLRPCHYSDFCRDWIERGSKTAMLYHDTLKVSPVLPPPLRPAPIQTHHHLKEAKKEPKKDIQPKKRASHNTKPILKLTYNPLILPIRPPAAPSQRTSVSSRTK
jgi:hypothetical protein